MICVLVIVFYVLFMLLCWFGYVYLFIVNCCFLVFWVLRWFVLFDCKLVVFVWFISWDFGDYLRFKVICLFDICCLLIWGYLLRIGLRLVMVLMSVVCWFCIGGYFLCCLVIVFP